MAKVEKGLGVVCPIVHLNGTSQDELVRLRLDFLHALRDAAKKLYDMAPNGRDYYPVDGLFPKAVKQQERRQETMKTLIGEIEFEVEQILYPKDGT